MAALLASSLSTASLASVSPRALLASILAAARAERSVHYLSTSSFGDVGVTQVCDVGLTRGLQRIIYRKGGSIGRVTVLVAAQTAYIRGDAFTLVNYMGFKAAPSAKYAGVWVRIPHTDRDYSTVAAGVTLSSTMAELKPTGPLSRVPDTRIGGQRVVGVRATASTARGAVVVTLYARAAGSPLPVKEVVRRADNARFTVTLSNWSEPIRLVIPSKAVPISKTGLE